MKKAVPRISQAPPPPTMRRSTSHARKAAAGFLGAAAVAWGGFQFSAAFNLAATNFDQERLEAERGSERAAEEQPAPQSLDREALHRFDRAIRRLDNAVRLAPHDRRLLIDRAAARLTHRQAEREFQEHGTMLAAPNPGPEPSDTQILAYVLPLESGNLISLGGSEFSFSPGLQGVDVYDKIVPNFPRPYTKEDDLALELGVWGEMLQAGQRQDVAFWLGTARRTGKALSESGEYFGSDATTAIKQASTNPDRLAELAEAHVIYLETQLMRHERMQKEALTRLEKARRIFERTKSPFSALASIELGIQEVQHQGTPALEVLRRLRQTDENFDKYSFLTGRFYWALGLSDIGEGRLLYLFATYRAALFIAERAGASEDCSYQGSLGPPGLINNALALPPTRSFWHGATTFEADEGPEERNEWRPALDFRNEAVRLARAVGEPVSLSNALLQRSRLLLRLGNGRAAREDLAEARSLITDLHEEAPRQYHEVDLFLVESEIKPFGDPTKQREFATQALDFYRSYQHLYQRRQGIFKICSFVSDLYLVRARAELSLGNKRRAEGDLRRGIESIEGEREGMEDEVLQISFFDKSRDLFDEMIRLQAGSGAESALNFAERDRARALLDHLEPLDQVWAEPQPSRAIRNALPEEITVVEYRVFDDRLFTWMIRSDDIELQVQAVSALKVNKLVTDLRNSLVATGSGEPFASASGSLYDLLVRPILPHLAPGDQLLFVPDESLHLVPFRALLDRFTGRYLLQDWIVAVAPSASFYVKALERDRALALRFRQKPTILSIGNPRPNHRVAPGLSDLPQAEREAVAAARNFAGAVVLTEERATETAFLSEAGQHDLIHFGGHAVENEDYPFLSYLLMAPENPRDSGLLFAQELYRHRFDRPRLAVLAACETGAGQIRSEGVLSIARAFLAAGVPTVVASLWNVEDRATSRLFTTFYERLHQGDDPAAALRWAQLRLLEQGEPVRDWAAFEVIGGVAPGWKLGRAGADE